MSTLLLTPSPFTVVQYNHRVKTGTEGTWYVTHIENYHVVENTHNFIHYMAVFSHKNSMQNVHSSTSSWKPTRVIHCLF